MKTAISIPDALFNEAEITAKQLGLARSQLYAIAIKEYVEHHNRKNITEKLNALYSQSDNETDSTNYSLNQLREATEDDTW